MIRSDETIWCDGCGVEIGWGAVMVGKRRYCCQDCQDGLPCECGAHLELEDERREIGFARVETPGQDQA